MALGTFSLGVRMVRRESILLKGMRGCKKTQPNITCCLFSTHCVLNHPAELVDHVFYFPNRDTFESNGGLLSKHSARTGISWHSPGKRQCMVDHLTSEGSHFLLSILPQTLLPLQPLQVDALLFSYAQLYHRPGGEAGVFRASSKPFLLL